MANGVRMAESIDEVVFRCAFDKEEVFISREFLEEGTNGMRIKPGYHGRVLPNGVYVNTRGQDVFHDPACFYDSRGD